MANSSAKNLIRANNARLRQLRQLILATNAVYLVIRGGVFRSTFDQTSASLAGLFLALYAGPYIFLAWAARPVYSPSGALQAPGEDLSQSGVLEYTHDGIYVTALAHIGCIFSPYAVLLLSVMPIAASVMLCAKCCGNGSGGDAEDEADAVAAANALGPGMSRKDRRKAERSGKHN